MAYQKMVASHTEQHIRRAAGRPKYRKAARNRELDIADCLISPDSQAYRANRIEDTSFLDIINCWQPLATPPLQYPTIMSSSQKVRQADGLLMHVHDAASGPV